MADKLPTATSDSYSNTVREGVPYSADLEPAGPDYGNNGYGKRLSQGGPVTEDPYGLDRELSQDDVGDLYAGLPAVPTANHPA